MVGTSGLAIAALVLGILGFPFGPLSIGAIVCGILGMKETGVGDKKGRGMAVAGLVLGCVALALWGIWGLIALIGSHHIIWHEGLELCW